MYRFLCEHVFSVLLGVYLGLELLGHRITLCLIFWGTIKLHSKETVTFYMQCMRITLSLNPCQHLLMSFWLKSSWRVWNGISLWLWCAFPSWLAILTIFSCAYWPICMCSLENCIWIFCPFFNWVVRVLYVFWM